MLPLPFVTLIMVTIVAQRTMRVGLRLVGGSMAIAAGNGKRRIDMLNEGIEAFITT